MSGEGENFGIWAIAKIQSSYDERVWSVLQLKEEKKKKHITWWTRSRYFPKSL